MRRYTVVWSPVARRHLAELWLANPRLRQEIADASDEIEAALALRPWQLGEAKTEVTRLVVRPPLAILYRILEDDRQVRVFHVKIWYESDF